MWTISSCDSPLQFHGFSLTTLETHGIVALTRVFSLLNSGYVGRLFLDLEKLGERDFRRANNTISSFTFSRLTTKNYRDLQQIMHVEPRGNSTAHGACKGILMFKRALKLKSQIWTLSL